LIRNAAKWSSISALALVAKRCCSAPDEKYRPPLRLRCFRQAPGRLKPRLARSGLSNVHPARIEHERDTKIKRLAGKADRVLVDAPCSGLGTLRRNPDLKWRQSEASVAELALKQAAILDSAAKLVRPGGRVVYATCSLLTAENDAIIEAFLASHPDFTLTPASEVLAKHGIEIDRRYLAPAAASTQHRWLLCRCAG
jgi:16S rRNA C967 or C1407 C5-methylase (RsmB/RsmF family)